MKITIPRTLSIGEFVVPADNSGHNISGRIVAMYY